MKWEYDIENKPYAGKIIPILQNLHIPYHKIAHKFNNFSFC